ncbi:MAG: nucleotidyltransferase family protein [Acidobacteria bacterium]|nr:nucleotidyltransferase family protein [Acidobacteriota bacterium]
MNSDEIDPRLARALVGREWGPGASPSGQTLIDRATVHRVDRLLAAVLVADPAIAPQVDRTALRRRLRDAAALEMAHRVDVVRLIEACARAGVHPVLFKGDAMAYGLYPEPHLRPRSDSDLLIHPRDRPRTESALAACGYVPETESLGTLSTFQSHWTRPRRAAPAHAVDLHWRLFNAEPFAHVLDVDEVDAAAVALPALGRARAPSLEHQLIITAVHRVAHHYDAGHLLWLYDIHLLVGVLGGEGIARAADLALARGVGAVVGRGLSRAAGAFGTPVPDEQRRRLDAAPPAPAVRIFLEGRPRQVDVLRANLTTLTRWRARVALLRDHLFPSEAYMRSMYPRCPPALLGLAYLHRIVRGAPKWFRRPTL